ncbi:aspartate carbamoyltransferase [bacterium]|nr:aspartate carbamoyltransferase [bacterium]
MDQPRANEIRHILRGQDFDLELIEELFKRIDTLDEILRDPIKLAELQNNGRGRQVFTVFYEPSTRTRMSFEAAANNLGFAVVGTENAREFSSAAKGETIEDTIRVMSGYYPAAIVMRHHEDGAATRAAAASNVPIINAGDGRGQHPTQALLDLYTLHRELGRTKDLTVLVGGDLANGRTARSLVYLLSKFNNIEFIFVAPESLKMSDDIKLHLDERGIKYTETEDLENLLPEADVVYWTRVQKERLATGVNYEQVKKQYELSKNHLALMKKDAIIMHPLPRINEIQIEVDEDPRAAYFRQAAYGLPVRMALYEWVTHLL